MQALLQEWNSVLFDGIKLTAIGIKPSGEFLNSKGQVVTAKMILHHMYAELCLKEGGGSTGVFHEDQDDKAGGSRNPHGESGKGTTILALLPKNDGMLAIGSRNRRLSGKTPLKTLPEQQSEGSQNFSKTQGEEAVELPDLPEKNNQGDDESNSSTICESEYFRRYLPIPSLELHADEGQGLRQENEVNHQDADGEVLVPLQPSTSKALWEYLEEDNKKRVESWVEESKKSNHEEYHYDDLEVQPPPAKRICRNLVADFDKVEPPKPSCNPDKPFGAPRTKRDKKLSNAELCINCKPWVDHHYPDPEDLQRANYLQGVCKHRVSIWKAPQQDTPSQFWFSPRYSTQELYDGGHINVANTPFTPIPRKRRTSGSDDSD